MNGTASGLLEPCAGKLASTVLRGRGSGDAAPLPDLELGAAVRKGETGSTVVFASRFTMPEADGKGGEVDREVPFLKAYCVFNVEQIDGLPDHYHHQPTPVLNLIERVERADLFFLNTGARIRHGGNQAFFAPDADFIQMPPLETFKDAASYYATLSHERTHWTAAEGRVGRDLSRYARDRSARARRADSRTR